MTKKIQSISLPRLNNAAHFAFNSDVEAAFAADEVASEKVGELLPAYKGAFKVEDAAFLVSRKSFLTDAIAQADDERDVLYATLRSNVKRLSKLADPAMREACKVLSQAIKEYKIDVTCPLDEETALLTNLLGDLGGKYKDAVAILSQGSTVEMLREANKKVVDAVRARNSENVSKPTITMAAARLETDNAYLAIVEFINACVVIERTHELDAIIDVINGFIARYRQHSMKQKAKKAEAGNGKTEADGEKTETGSGQPATGGGEELPDPVAPTLPSDSDKNDGGGGSSGESEEDLPDPLS
jgi:hypothetical protein